VALQLHIVMQSAWASSAACSAIFSALKLTIDSLLAMISLRERVGLNHRATITHEGHAIFIKPVDLNVHGVGLRLLLGRRQHASVERSAVLEVPAMVAFKGANL
jgi:hypothetical protein